MLKDEINRLPEIKHWNFDLSDPDLRVFRIEAVKNISETVISLFARFDFKCMELTAEKNQYFSLGSEKASIVNSKLFIRGVSALLVSGLIFWIGAFSPPYRQWMTNSTTEYLSIIHNNPTNWYAIHIAFVLGVIGSLAALLFILGSLKDETKKALLTLATGIYGVGTALVLINFSFRLTVTQWVAKRLIENNQLDESFKTWMDWSNMLFDIYMMSGYFTCLFLGLALKQIVMVPRWVTNFCLIFGACALVCYPLGVLIFQPPLMIHFPFIMGSIVILLERRKEPKRIG